MVNAALSQLCLRRLGFDPAQLSPEAFQRSLPLIAQALVAEHIDTLRVAEVVQKSAIGLVQPEGAISRQLPDPNAVLDSVFPFLYPESVQ